MEVFIIPHTHIDQGWLTTVKGYESSVHGILNSVANALKNDGDRKFNWGEVYYFRTWYQKKSTKDKQYIKHLIQEGRFSFVGFGLIQNDEALPSYSSIITQFSQGLNYLKSEFSIRPKIAWQIDPFGHDLRMVQICAQMGFDALFINRVHFKIKNAMKKNKALEFIWQVGEDYKIFTHTLYKHYSSPEHFDFERGIPQISASNVKHRSDKLMSHFKKLRKDHLTNHLFIPIGDDFKFKDAGKQYRNWDKMIDYINKNYGNEINIRYSTLEEYVKSIFEYSNKNSVKFPVVKHDFFPYQDGNDAWWTGFYSTWPKLKRQIRQAEESYNKALSIYSVAKNLISMDKKEVKDIEDALEDSLTQVSVAQHHDFITGTSKRKAIDDYFTRTKRCIDRSNEVEKKVIFKLLLKNNVKGSSVIEKVGKSVLKCEGGEGSEYGVVIYNPSNTRDVIINFQTNSRKLFASFSNNENGKHIPYQATPYVFQSLKKEILMEKYFNIFMKIKVPAFSIMKISIKIYPDDPNHHSNHALDGNSVFYITKIDKKKKQITEKFNSENNANFFRYEYLEDIKDQDSGDSNNPITISNYKYSIFINPKTGYIKRIIDKENSISHLYDDDMIKSFKTSQSGAYLFRPTKEESKFDNKLFKIFVSKGRILDEVYVIMDRLHYYLRVFHGTKSNNNNQDSKLSLKELINFEYFLPTIPQNNEVVFQLFTKILQDSSKKTSLFTYNGLYFNQRDFERNVGQYPLAGKWYPSPNGAVLRNLNGQINLFLPSVFGVSASKNKLKVMLHRRLQRDDFRGMSEGNNDRSTPQNSFFFSYDSPNYSKKFFENFQRTSVIINRPVSVYSILKNSNLFSANFSILKNNFWNEYLELLSFERKNVYTSVRDVPYPIIIRVRNLKFEEEICFNPVEIFNGKILSVREKSLNEFYDLILHKSNSINSFRDVSIFEESSLGDEIYFNIKSGKIERNNKKILESPLFITKTGDGNDVLSYKKLSMSDIEGGCIGIKPGEIKTFEILIKFKKNQSYVNVYNDENDIMTVRDNGINVNIDPEEQMLIEELLKGEEKERERFIIDHTKKESGLSKKYNPRKTLIIYLIILPISIVVLYCIFTAQKRKKRNKKRKKVPLEKIVIRKGYKH